MYGTPVKHGLLAIGQDPVAVDSICADLMGYTSSEIDYLFLANWAGVGQGENIITRGVDPDSITITYQKPPSL